MFIAFVCEEAGRGRCQLSKERGLWDWWGAVRDVDNQGDETRERPERGADGEGGVSVMLWWWWWWW